MYVSVSFIHTSPRMIPYRLVCIHSIRRTQLCYTLGDCRDALASPHTSSNNTHVPSSIVYILSLFGRLFRYVYLSSIHHNTYDSISSCLVPICITCSAVECTSNRSRLIGPPPTTLCSPSIQGSYRNRLMMIMLTVYMI